MKSSIIFLAILLTPAAASSATIYVPIDYPKIQDAIDNAANGDTIIVKQGIYVENIDFLGKAITVESEEGPEVTIINGGKPSNPDFRSVAIFQNGEGHDSVLRGFTLTMGSGTKNSMGNYAGGGINCDGASPVISNNVIQDNSTDSGGGIACSNGAAPLISDNTICFNSTPKYTGGGIYCSSSSPKIRDNYIAGNRTYIYGGGIYCYSSSPEIKGNVIRNNVSSSSGGGIYLTLQCSPLISLNDISDNNAPMGGGIFSTNSSPEITGNLIASNRADNEGGGIYSQLDSTHTITNNTITKNSAASKGGGIYCKATPSLIITNTILWSNQAIRGPEIWLGYTGNPTTLWISYSDVNGGTASIYVDPGCTLNWGSHMIDQDPRFVDPPCHDFHLIHPSPCRDFGNNSAPGLPNEDFEGDPRIAYGVVDMGADEFHPHLYYVGQATPGGIVQLRIVGWPQTSPVRLWIGSGLLDPPLPTKYGDWYLLFPLIAEADLGAIPSPDGVLSYSAHLDPGLPVPLDVPMQSGVGNQLTNPAVLEVR